MAIFSKMPKSETIAGLEWLSPRVSYPIFTVRGDTFPQTWAADGDIYASAGDPLWGAGPVGVEEQKGSPAMSGLDVQRFMGSPPDHRIEKVNDMPDYVDWGGEGPKPSGMISVSGALYLAVQNLLGKKPPAHGEKCQHGSDAFIVCSKDFGKTWSPDFKEQLRRGPMFPGCTFGGPSFVQYGRDSAAPDSFVYAVSGDQWDNGSELRVGRVPKDRILDAMAWEFVSGLDAANRPGWTRDLHASAPVLALDRQLSLPEMVRLPGSGRYLLLTWRLHQDFKGDTGSSLLVLDAPAPWGPFSLVHYEELWEGEKAVNPYCPRVPLKWFDARNNEGWLQFSGSWEPVDNRPHYRSHVRKFRLKMKA
ncbi:MAG: hypothetical protein V1809_15505 [Planctomycetota bacterium]